MLHPYSWTQAGFLANITWLALRREHHAAQVTRLLCWLLQPYQPSLSVSWLFQRAMSLRPGQLRAPQKRKGAARRGWLAPNHINKLLCCNFQVMQVRPPPAAFGSW